MRDEDQPLPCLEGRFVATTPWCSRLSTPCVAGVQALGFSLHDRPPGEPPWRSGEESSTLEES